MAQHAEQKTLHPDKLLFFRMGDFYELFDEDAIIAAPILGIALTVRNRKSEDTTKMCGMPHHSIAGPINKLLNAGYKIAICDQLENPKEVKGLVKRGVTRVLSPGMVYDPEELDAIKANYLCSYDEKNIVFFEATTGDAFYFDRVASLNIQSIIEILSPAEVVLTKVEKQKYLQQKTSVAGPYVSEFEIDPDWKVPAGLKDYATLPKPFQALLQYAVSMQGEDLLSTLQPIQKRRWQSFLQLNSTVIKHLEILQTYDGEKKGSFIHSLQRTRTSSGARLWKQWALFPLTDIDEITKRQDQVEFWVKNFHPSEKICGVKAIREQLSGLGDIERRMGKICHPNSSPQDLLRMAQSLQAGLKLSAMTPFYSYSAKAIEAADKCYQEITNAIVEDAPALFNKTYFIKKGVRQDLDEWIDLTNNAEEKIKAMESSEQEKLGIPSLKIRYNNVFGYYIEVTNTHKKKVPASYLRKQTLTNAERYTTEDLQELERKVLSAKTKRFELENQVFKDIKENLLNSAAYILGLAKQWAELDVSTSLAHLAVEMKMVRPVFSKNRSYKIKKLRHPVVELIQKTPFIANDFSLENGSGILLTGPNMAGKSTIMRQIAVCSILAQMGSFVPAEACELPILDRIFTRIGASDSLSEGLSTFMVEMKECVEILNEATKDSLIIMDEIGRGTSTYDGMSLAQAIIESLMDQGTSYLIFSTHYHELTKLEAKFSKLKNYHMSIMEKGKDLSFLYLLKEGAANRSYGIHVASLAGMPKSLVKRAEAILKDLESGASSSEMSSHQQMDLFASAYVEETEEEFTNQEEHPIIEEFRSVKLDGMSPIDALNWLYEQKQNFPND